MKPERPRKRSNLRDVAKAAGVSVATVSRVLNAPQTVTPKTREKVEAAIRELRFVPSAAARAINSGRTRFVGALVPTLDNAIFAKFLAALEQKLGQSNLSLVVATTGNDPKIEAEKAQGLMNIGAEGLVLSGIHHDPTLYELIERTQVPAIATSYYAPQYDLPTIGYDNVLTSETAMKYLVGLGHTDIAVVHGQSDTNDRTRARLAGVANVTNAKVRYYNNGLSLMDGRVAAREIIKADVRPTAILCLSDVIAMGVLFELQRHGISVPDDISLMGMDDLPGASNVYPALTTVHLPVSRMGEAAAVAIAGWVEDREVPEHRLFEPTLMERESTARRS